MYSTLFYTGETERRYADLMPKIQKLARLHDGLQTKGRSKDALKVQARMARYARTMGKLPQFVDWYEYGTQLISLFGLEWDEVSDIFTDQQGRMTPAHTMRFLARLTARERLFARNARRASVWWILWNPILEWRLRRKYADLRAYLQTALKRKEVLGVAT